MYIAHVDDCVKEPCDELSGSVGCILFDELPFGMWEIEEGKVCFLSKKFSVVVNEKWCKGCALCVGVCPKKVLELNQQVKSTPVRMDDCIGCHQCDNICPDFAITVKECE